VFAEFLREKLSGMLRIRQAAVGIEKHGILRVELDQSSPPKTRSS